MTFSDRLKTSMELLKSSLQVIRRHPRLMLFPIASSGFMLLLALFFFAPIIGLVVSEIWWNPRSWEVIARGAHQMGKEEALGNFMRSLATGFYAYGVLIYLVSTVLAAFFNVAFYHEILRSLAGETPSLRRGLRFAWSRSSAILRWSLLAGTVGALIKAIEDRLGWIGKIVMGFFGATWSVASVFAIPVIVRRDEKNPVRVLRDSAATLKQTWGESVSGFVGIQVVGTVAIIGLTFLAIGAFTLSAKLHAFWLIVTLLAGWLTAITAIGVLLSMATHIYRCALYVYASEGVVPGPYTAELMDAGWRVRK